MQDNSMVSHFLSAHDFKTLHRTLIQADNISNKDLIDTFAACESLKEYINSLITLQYIANQDLSIVFKIDSYNNLKPVIIAFYESLLKQLNDLQAFCIYCRLYSIHAFIHAHIDIYDDVSLFVNFEHDINKLPDIYIKDKLIYKFKNNISMKDYFDEITSSNFDSYIIDCIDSLKRAKDSIVEDVHKIQQLDKYYYLTFIYEDITLAIHINYNKVPGDIPHYLFLNKPVRIFYQDLSYDKLVETCDKILLDMDVTHLCNGYIFINYLQEISTKIGYTHKVYYPPFRRHDKLSLLTGDFGLQSVLPKNLKNILFRGFMKIRASIELADYPLSQCIIHSHAYIIEYSKKIIFNGTQYKIFMLRYFNKPFIIVTDLAGKRVSVSMRRKILNNWSDYQDFVNEINGYFVIDVQLIDALNNFRQHQAYDSRGNS